MKTQLIQDLISAKKQLNYTNEALYSNLEKWEIKEFELVKISLLEEIKSLENRIEFLK
jgi:hypothetical protein